MLILQKKLFIYDSNIVMKKYYKITFSSKIDKIKDGVINSSGQDGARCSLSTVGVAIPSTISEISDMAFYECENIQSIKVNKQVYNRPEGTFEIPIRLNGQTIIEKIKEREGECTVFPFELKMPLCPEEK
jgi:hypothetical protein